MVRERKLTERCFNTSELRINRIELRASSTYLC